MSRAFVKDDDAGSGGELLPDRLISEHANLVTAEGLAAIEAEAARVAKEYGEAQVNGEKLDVQRVQRDLRYWSARRASAELQPRPPDDGRVHFGTRVTIERGDGRRQTYRIVGEDEADPQKGTVSYVSPLAQALLGKREGDEIRAGATSAEIIKIG